MSDLNEQRRLAGLPEVDEMKLRVGGIEKASAPPHEVLVKHAKHMSKLAKEISVSLGGLGATGSALAKMVDLYREQHPTPYDSSYNQVATLLKEEGNRLEKMNREVKECQMTLDDVTKTIQREFKE